MHLVTILGTAFGLSSFFLNVILLKRLLHVESILEDMHDSVGKIAAKASAEAADPYGLDARLEELRHMRFSTLGAKIKNPTTGEK